MFNLKQVENLLDNATKLDVTDAALRAKAYAPHFAHWHSNPYQNAATYASSSSDGSRHLGKGNHWDKTGAGNHTLCAAKKADFISGGMGWNRVYTGIGANRVEIAKGSTSEASWLSGQIDLNAQRLARIRQGNGETAIQIAQAFNYELGFSLETIANALDDGASFSYTDIAKGLWNSGYSFDSKKLADLLWDEGASQAEIGQALHYGIGLDLAEIAIDLKYGVTTSDASNLNYNDVAVGLWNSGYSLDPRKLADLLWDTGASQAEIGQALRIVGMSLEDIADALDDGVTKSDGTNLNYTDVAVGLWNSGYSFESKKLSDLLWDEGATEIEISRALHYGIGLDLAEIAIDLRYGVTKSDGTNLNYTDVAVGLWNSEYIFDSKKLADLLWDTGASQAEIGQALHYGIGLDLAEIAIDLKYGVTTSDGSNLNYNDVAVGLWNSGDEINNARQLADLLWDTGASITDVGQALRSVNISLEGIADALDDGVTNERGRDLNYTDVALGLWNSGYQFDTRKLADLLWDEGASQADIGQALRSIGISLEGIADALDDGVTKSNGSRLNYTDVALGLWNSGYQFDTRKLADLLWDEGASQADIGQAFRYLGFGLPTIADAIKYGVTQSNGAGLNYIDAALGLWKSGYSFDARKLADLLWNTGASPAEIGQALWSVGVSLRGIADALDDGNSGFNYIDVADALTSTGTVISSTTLADLLWDEGASQADIGQALRSVGLGLTDIADGLKYGVTKSDGTRLNYTDVALGLWNSGYSFGSRKLADLLWDEGASQADIGQAFRYLGFGLPTIADAIKYGVTQSNGTGLNYFDVAEALWNSGIETDSREVADVLWQTQASVEEIGQALRSIGISKEGIADALDDGNTGFNYKQVASAVWNSGYGIHSEELGDILRHEGASAKVTIEVLQSVADVDYGTAVYEVAIGIFNDAFNDLRKEARGIAKDAETFYDKNKSILAVVATPLVIAVEGTKIVVQSVESGNIEPIVGALERIPVVGTAVGAIEGVISAYNGDEQGALTDSIVAALGFYGATNTITRGMVEFAVDVFWKLKDSNYKGAISTALTDLGLEETAAKVFVSTAWALEKGDWKTAVNAALAEVHFSNAKEFVDIAWDIIDQDYQGMLKTGLELVGFNTLGIDQAKADAFIKVTAAIRDNNFNQVADELISLAGNNAQQVSQSSWIKDLRDGNPANARQAIQTGLSELGFKNAPQWVATSWAVKDGKYLDALSGVLSLGDFKERQNWLRIIDNFQKENYLDGLSTAFTLAGFKEGQSLAEAAISVRKGDFIEAFYDGFDLLEGGSDLKDAFKALKKFALQEFITSMIKALPLLKILL